MWSENSTTTNRKGERLTSLPGLTCPFLFERLLSATAYFFSRLRRSSTSSPVCKLHFYHIMDKVGFHFAVEDLILDLNFSYLLAFYIK